MDNLSMIQQLCVIYVGRRINGKNTKSLFRKPLRETFLVATLIVFLIQNQGNYKILIFNFKFEFGNMPVNINELIVRLFSSSIMQFCNNKNE